MKFGYVIYDIGNYQKALRAEGKAAQKDIQVALNAGAAIMERAIRMTSPNSRKSGRSWRGNPDLINRSKWGVLSKAVGKYLTRPSRLKSDEHVGVNVGFLMSKQKKYFVARFLDSGAYNAQTDRNENYYKGYLKVVEQMTMPLVKSKFEQVVNERVSARMANFNKRWTKF